MNKPLLIILRAGSNSIHVNWPIIRTNRNLFDILIIGYGDSSSIVNNINGEIYPILMADGAKYKGISHYIDIIEDLLPYYSYVWFPDDDISFDEDFIERLLEFLERSDELIACFQPSLSLDSYWSHPITLRHSCAIYRETTFVEMMTPVFRSRYLPLLFWTFDINCSGWGIEYLWFDILRRRSLKLAIIDTVTVKHTRPVGGQKRSTDIVNELPGQELEKLRGIFSDLMLEIRNTAVFISDSPEVLRDTSHIKSFVERTTKQLGAETTKSDFNYMRRAFRDYVDQH